jgi:DNA-directed RNA polymerase specialized sigma24 family protein
MGSPAVGSPEWLVAVYPRLLRHLQDFRIGRAWAEDAAQHAVAQALRRIEALRRSPNPLGWLLVTGRHYIFDRIQERRARGSLPASKIDDRRDGRSGAIRAVWEGLQQLPEQGRAILEWYYFEGLTDEQIGLAIFTTGTPQARGQRARKCRLKAKAQLRYLLLQMDLATTLGAAWGSRGED